MTAWRSTASGDARADLREYEVLASTRAFARRVEAARDILRRGATLGPCAVCVSWGKDSLALAHLALDTLGAKVPLFHMAGTPMPGYEESVAYFHERATVHTLPAPKTLDETIAWCQSVGLPHERTQSEQKRVVQAIKRDRGTEWAMDHGIAVQVLGMRIDEGGPRARLLRKRGPTYQTGDGLWKCNPLAWWSSKDVWAYIASHRIPYNRRIYDAETHGQTRETIRNTSWLSTDGAEDGRIAWLAFHFPEEYALLAGHFPQVRMMR